MGRALFVVPHSVVEVGLISFVIDNQSGTPRKFNREGS